jgi:hypothetical protein
VTRTHPSRTSRLSALIAGAGVVAAIAMLAAPGASAKVTSAGGLDYVTTKVSTEAGKQTTARADCPAGTSPIGGGASTSGSFGEQQLVGLAPIDRGDKNLKPDDAWATDADNLSAATKTMKAFAICGPGPVDYYTSGFYSMPAGGSNNVGVGGYCADPEHAVSAGVLYDSKGLDFAHVIESTSEDGVDAGIERDDGWSVGAQNDSAYPIGMALRVVCATGDYAYAEQPFTSTAGGRTAVTAACPKSMHVVGGGIDNGGSVKDTSLSAFRPVDGADADRAPDDGWKVGVDDTDQFPASALVYATCQA